MLENNLIQSPEQFLTYVHAAYACAGFLLIALSLHSFKQFRKAKGPRREA